MIQGQYDDPDQAKETVAGYGGVNLGPEDGRWRLQLGGTVVGHGSGRKAAGQKAPDQDTAQAVFQIRF